MILSRGELSPREKLLRPFGDACPCNKKCQFLEIFSKNLFHFPTLCDILCLRHNCIWRLKKLWAFLLRQKRKLCYALVFSSAGCVAAIGVLRFSAHRLRLVRFFIFIPFCAQAPLCKGSWRPNGRLRGCYNNPSASCLGTSLYTREAVPTEIRVQKARMKWVSGDTFLKKGMKKCLILKKCISSFSTV